MRDARYSRVLLKVSGESLKGSADSGIEPNAVAYLAEEIGQVHEMGIEIGVVIGVATSGEAKLPNPEGWTGLPPTMRACWPQ